MAWKKVETRSNDGDGVWLTPERGAVVEGTLKRAFPFQGDAAKWQAAYEIEGRADGFSTLEGKEVVKVEKRKGTFLLSERGSFRDAIRALQLGTKVRITFISKEPLKGTKANGRTFWETMLDVDDEGVKGELVRDVLRRQYQEQTARASDEVPF